MDRVPLPDALDSVGVVDTGNGEQLPVSDVDGVRYVEADDETAASIRRGFADAYDDYDADATVAEAGDADHDADDADGDEPDEPETFDGPDAGGGGEGDEDAPDVDGPFDADDWLEHDYEARASMVESGAMDDHLDAVLQAETSQTVIDAVEARRGDA